jgi:hypothetical protein
MSIYDQKPSNKPRQSVSINFDRYDKGPYTYCSHCNNLVDYQHNPNTSTRKDDQVGKKGHEFNLWMRNILPSSHQGLLLTDIDMVLMNYKSKQFMMLEIKTGWNENSAPKQSGQYSILAFIDSCIKSAQQREYTYLGTHLIKCTGRYPGEGLIYWDKETESITQQELIKRLSV